MEIHSFVTLLCVDWYIFNEKFVFVVYFNVCVIGIFYYDAYLRILVLVQILNNLLLF